VTVGFPQVWAKPTQTLLKHIKQKPAVLVAAAASAALPLPDGISVSKVRMLRFIFKITFNG